MVKKKTLPNVCLFLLSPGRLDGSCFGWWWVFLSYFLPALWRVKQQLQRVNSARQEKTVCFIDKGSGWLVLRERSCYCGKHGWKKLYCWGPRDLAMQRILQCLLGLEVCKCALSSLVSSLSLRWVAGSDIIHDPFLIKCFHSLKNGQNSKKVFVTHILLTYK